MPGWRIFDGMGTYVALLGGINVGGHRKVGMPELRDLLAQLGFQDVRSLLQTGNLIFRSEGSSPAELERALERESAERLGLETDFFVRSAEEWRAVIDRNPFPREAARDPAHLVVMLLKGEPPAAAPEALQGAIGAISGREVVRVDGRHAYLVYPDGIGRSRLTNALIERHLGTRGTARNWNTVQKLAALTRTRNA